MKFVCVFFAVIISIVAINGQSDAKWEEYKKLYGKNYKQKSYNGQDEESLRKDQFMKTYAAIQKANSNGNNLFKQGLNVFSDMFPNEIAARKGAKKPVDDKGTNLIRIAINSEDRQALPASLDYTTHPCMAPIRDQGSCGSCWSFATINPLEFSACNKTTTKVLTQLSEQHLIDCDLSDYACEGGWPTSAWAFIKANNGAAKAASYLYTSYNCCPVSTCCATKTCKYTSSMLGAKVSNFTDFGITPPSNSVADETRVSTFGNVVGSTSSNTALIMQMALLQYGPLAVAITAADSLNNYMSGVYNDVACDNLDVDHAINIVGFGTTTKTACTPATDYWIIRNSWGDTWGNLGYGWIQRDVNKCSIESYPMAVVAA